MDNSAPSDVTRRTLLQAAVGAPAVAAAASVTSAALGAGTAEAAGGRRDPDVPRFTLAVLPDTQYLIDEGGSDPEPVREALRYAVRSRDERNIVFLAHLGDVTEHGTETEMRTAEHVFRSIHRRLPYSVLAGNHDVSGDDQRGDTPYLRTFGPRRFAGMPTYRGSSPDGYHSAHVLRGGGREWLLLALDWRVTEHGIAWAQRTLDRHSTLPTILTTHDFVWGDDEGGAHLSGHGRHLWDGLVRRNDQIFLTLSGHYWPPGRTTLTNDHGNPVHAHITNYQDRYYGGAGMLRLYSFDLARGCVDVETISPWLLAKQAERRTPLEAETVELTGDVDRFTVEIDFEARFAGFAPPVVPPARPAEAVLVPGTVAYWRFDGSGLAGGADGSPVPSGAVARDLSGHGNDLTVQRLHSSGPGVLTFSAEHHETQPAHASLRFDGGKNPDRGAVLRTGPDAPLNSMTFERGYTIETFLKLPEPFEGDHAWMGILSWEGRAGDAGKTSGWSPEEPTCSLNLSGERFLQFVVYPTDVDADPTSWSHALPVGRWTHVAVVNDGRHTVVYVDGSRIARNAAERSRGITTLGKPFALGGTQFAGKFGQGFYGWLGDTRITARPLDPAQFLPATRTR
ncbi:calcineurin-like phosphoesterase family protein [Prauserella shujinwangii]|uniref:Calcineurin-like phosphoesterase family protein n=1 Tax=Prauserella shujinwangii TaxID=1453103 RepID=A0A2T0LW47_9PSEU|nr:LamG-like jellyroll fold domain-containing protein [Prauserella shujinwangii]PRX48245.1 calcineurin-like phosphoesterase family protein [Prauserella shujinwangii]